MIAGELKYINRYTGIHPDLESGLEAVVQMDPVPAIGNYKINDRVTLIISSYETTLNQPVKYEAHRKMIDIQYAVSGQERVDWSPLTHMELSDAHDEEKDRAFWINPSQNTSVTIGQGIFAVFFPEDAHRPCLPGPAGAEKILKATVKIENWK